MNNLEAWLIARVAREAGLAPDAVDATTPLYRYGLDSRALMAIVEHAEAEFSMLADLDLISPAEPICALLQALRPV